MSETDNAARQDDSPFNVSAVLETSRGVVITNSIPDAETLININVVATANTSGFQGWPQHYSKFFAAKKVYILHYPSESFYAIQVAKQVYNFASAVKIVQIPAGFITETTTKNDIIAIISDAPSWEPPPPLPDDELPPYDEQLSDDGLIWEPPVDIFGKLQPPALKQGLLPEAIQSYVHDQAELIGVDPGVIGIASLIVCATAIDDRIQIQPKQHEYGWTESARLWGAIVGDPSVKKSPSLKKATSPLRKIDIQLNEENAKSLHDYKIDKKIHQKAEENYIKDATKAHESGEKPPNTRPDPLEHPECPRAVVEDSTIEKLSEIMRYNSRGVLCLRDELSGWFGAMDAYSNSKAGSKDRPLWLESYNGGPRNIDRIQRGSFIVPNWSISMLGGIQPDTMRKVSAKTTDDGLLQRFMVIVAQDAPEGVDRPPNRVAAERYSKLVEHIFNTSPTTQPILLSPGALEVKSMLDKEIRRFRAFGEMCTGLMSHLAKWEGLFPRLLLTFHVINSASAQKYPDSMVPRETAEQVYRFMMDYLFPHSVHFYIEVLDHTEHMEHARWIAEFILSRGLESVSKRDVVANYRALRKQPSWVIKNAMGFLETSGWLQPVKYTGGEATRWEVNPIIHTEFKDKAESEKQRRAEAREVLQETFRGMRVSYSETTNQEQPQ